jgi:hypothetical protein
MLHRHGIVGHERRGDRLRYGEREYSIDETPAFPGSARLGTSRNSRSGSSRWL